MIKFFAPCILCFSIAIAVPWRATSSIAPSQRHHQAILFDNLSTPLIVASLALIFWITAPQSTRDRLATQLHPINLICNMVTQYTSHMSTTCAHEMGHALAYKILMELSSTIHLGASTPAKSLVQCGPLHIDGLDPNKGHTDLIITKEWITQQLRSPQRTKQALCLLAGGLAGILGHYLICHATKKPIKFDSITINQLINALIPITSTSDGTKLWRDCIRTTPQLINLVMQIVPYLAIAGELYCTSTDPHTSDNAAAHSIFLIGLINYFLRGYVHFYI
jgi:hypothetical protein